MPSSRRGRPLLDEADENVAVWKERGYVSVDELNSALPEIVATAAEIEDVMAMLNRLGINIVEQTDPPQRGAFGHNVQ